MGRFRNPRYAPEFLERRLSPTTIVGVLPTGTACYSYSTPTEPTSNPPSYTYTTPTEPPAPPPTNGGEPIISSPTDPVGPALPA